MRAVSQAAGSVRTERVSRAVVEEIWRSGLGVGGSWSCWRRRRATFFSRVVR